MCFEYDATEILAKCHDTPCEGHFGGQKTTAKVLQGGYFLLTLFQDEKKFVVKCD